ncbi:MAG TPA: hypothetical protein ENK18_10870 [Deltaproteobacteria bacterium]|nr:hypothetical protein [Deltaproteobacteria bacterium]
MSFATDATDATWPAPQVPKEVVVQRIAQEATLVLPRAPEIDTEPEPPTELLRAPTELLRAPTELLRAPTELLQAPTRHLPVPDARRRSRRRGADPADIAVTSSLAGLAVVIFVTMTVGGFLILWQVVL